jgi:O-antigen/teichoic acid export membrane protein
VPPIADGPAEPGADILDSGEAGGLFVRGGALRVGAYVGGIMTSIAVMPFVARHLRSTDFGRYVVVTSLIVIVAALTEGGLANLGVREFAAAPNLERREFMRSLIGMRISLSVLGGLAAIGFAVLVGYPRVVVEGTVIATVGLVLTNLQVTLAVPLTAALRLRWLAALDLLGPSVTAVGLIALVLLGAPLLPFFAAAVFAYAAILALTMALVRGEVAFRPAFSVARCCALLRESAVFAAATALATIYFQVVVIAMSVISTPRQTGVFSLAFRILTVVNGIPLLLVGSAFPILLRAARDDRERLHYAVQRLLEADLLFGGWLSLLVVAGAPFAVQVIGGPGYPGAATILRILGAGVIATFLSAVLAFTLLALGAYRALIATSIGAVVLAVALCAILIPAHGARGAAIVTLVLELGLACAYAAVLGTRHRELRPELALIGRIALALALAFAAALALPVSSVPAAAIGTGVLTVSALALRAIPSELLHALRMR